MLSGGLHGRNMLTLIPILQLKVASFVEIICNSSIGKCLAQVYPRPGMIINHDLINHEHIQKNSLDSSSIGLKDHLLEHHDFEAVSKEVFEILAIWYGCDYEVIRFLRPDPSHPDRFFLDLFPSKRFAQN